MFDYEMSWLRDFEAWCGGLREDLPIEPKQFADRPCLKRAATRREGRFGVPGALALDHGEWQPTHRQYLVRPAGLVARAADVIDVDHVGELSGRLDPEPIEELSRPRARIGLQRASFAAATASAFNHRCAGDRQGG